MSFRIFVVSVLTGLCVSEFSLHLRQYFFIDRNQTWTKAQKYCRQHYTDLATINDVQDLDILAGLSGSGDHVSFVGLYKTWSWSLSDDDDHQGETSYRNWANNQPRKFDCGSVGSKGQWIATGCKDELNFICYNASESNIHQRFALVDGSSRTWSEAQAYCKTNYTDLARVRNKQENEVLRKMLTKNPAWFGLRVLSWVWSDGSQPSFQPWEYDKYLESRGDCGALVFGRHFHRLIGMSCGQNASFFCYSEPQRRHLVQIKFATKGSYIDARDPAVALSIKNWIQRELEEKGALTDVKVSWRRHPKEEKKLESTEELKNCV